MKFRRETKIIFIILAVMIVLALVYMIAEYPNLKNANKPVDQYISAAPSQPPSSELLIPSSAEAM